MSEENKASEGQVATTVTPAATAQLTPPAADDGKEPKWLPSRLERERAKVLEELGATPDEIKQALADKKAQLEAKKTAEEKALELQKDLEKVKGNNAKLQESLKVYANSRLSQLSPEQKAAVEGLAGSNPAEQLKAIDVLAPTWAIQAQVAADSQKAAQEAAQKAASQNIQNTLPDRNAPGGVSITQEEDQQVYTRLQKENPFAAADFAKAKSLIGKF